MSIIDKLREPYVEQDNKIKLHNKIIRKKQKIISKVTSSIIIGLASTSFVLGLNNLVDYLSPYADLQKGNYTKAKSNFGKDDRADLFQSVLKNIISPTTAENYNYFNYQDFSSLDFLVYKLSNIPDSKLIHLCHNNSDYLAFNDISGITYGYKPTTSLILSRWNNFYEEFNSIPENKPIIIDINKDVTIKIITFDEDRLLIKGSKSTSFEFPSKIVDINTYTDNYLKYLVVLSEKQLYFINTNWFKGI